jgi:hypothetical protein
MVVVKEQHRQEAKRQSNKNPLDLEIPEVDQPATVLGRIKSASDWDESYVRGFQIARKVGETNPEEGPQLSRH